MKLYTNTLPNVTPIKMLTATATYGTGFLTSIVKVFCELFGTKCDMYTILSYPIMLKTALETGYVTESQAKSLAEWRESPFEWGANHGWPKEEK